MNRREFIGGLIAVSALPSVADDLTVFPERGPQQRLSRVYRHIKIGLEKPFSVLHLSDTHLTAAYPHEEIFKTGKAAQRTKLFGGQQETALRYSLEWAKAHNDFVVHTGDLIDWQSEANFDLVKKYYGDVSFGSVGNHEFYTYLPDEKHTWQESFKERSWSILKEKYPVDARFAAQTVNGVTFVTLDDVFATVQPDQVEKFMAEAKKGLPIILCMHTPIFTEGIVLAKIKSGATAQGFWQKREMDSVGDCKRQLEDKTTAEFIRYLKGESLLKGVLCGHNHLVAQDRFSPTAMEYVCGCNYMFGVQDVTFT